MTAQEPSAPIHVAIIGAGIAGVLTCLKLLENPNIKPTIYEASSQFSQHGVGLSLDCNGIGALRQISPACYTAFKQHSFVPAHEGVWFRLAEATGAKAGKFFYDVPSPSETGTVHRAHFIGELAALLPPGVVQFNRKLEHIYEIPQEGQSKGALIARFTNNTAVYADFILGADGASSATRLHLLGESHPVAAYPSYSGMTIYRILLPMSIAEKAIGIEHAHAKTQECGPGGYFVHYPIELGATMNVALATYANKEWSGPWRREASINELRNAFKGWGGNVGGVIETLESLENEGGSGGKDALDRGNKRPEINVWGVFHYPYSPTYISSPSSGNLALIGDAAHSSTPNQGQGANQAIEDALVLGSLLSRVQRREQIRPAMEAYDEARRKRTQKVVSTSEETGWLYSFLDKDVGSDIEKIRTKTEGRWEWMWNVDLEREVSKAVESFEKRAKGKVINGTL